MLQSVGSSGTAHSVRGITPARFEQHHTMLVKPRREYPAT